MWPTKIHTSNYGREHLPFTKGSIDVRLLGEKHHNLSLIAGEGLLLNIVVVPLLRITSYIASLSI